MLIAEVIGLSLAKAFLWVAGILFAVVLVCVAVQQQFNRKCPTCRELISRKARKCPHCQESVTR